MYQLITLSDWNGLDEKQTVLNMKKAKALAQMYLSDGYDAVYVVKLQKRNFGINIHRVYDKHSKNGRLPDYTDEYYFK